MLTSSCLVKCQFAYLGVTIDSQLTFDKHVTNVVQSCNYHIRSLRHIRPLIDKDTAPILACSIVSSRLKYYNAVLYETTSINANPLQRVQNSLARVVCNASYHSSSQRLRQVLHWLPIKQRRLLWWLTRFDFFNNHSIYVNSSTTTCLLDLCGLQTMLY